MSAQNYICPTCGTQYPASEQPPEGCAICLDDRQYVARDGQRWTTLEAARSSGEYANTFTEAAPGITYITSTPRLGIPHRAYLVQSPHGNILWDVFAYLDDATIATIQQRGGVAAIALSHPHFQTTVMEWSRALGGVPVYIHADNAPWIMRPESVTQFWEGEARELLPGLTLYRCGGHFPGSAVLHWADAPNGGALFTGDTITIVADPRYVTFMYSYPNQIPLDVATVQRIADVVAPLPFAKLYDGWDEVAGDGNEAVAKSAARYIAHVRGA